MTGREIAHHEVSGVADFPCAMALGSRRFLANQRSEVAATSA